MKDIVNFFSTLPKEYLEDVSKRSTRITPYICEIIAANPLIKNVVEVGTFKGKSAVCMGFALRERGGKVYTINVSEPEIRVAKDLVARSGLDNVEILKGSSLDLLPGILPGLHFGLILIDGYHDYRHSMFECKIAQKYISKSCGVILLDDAGVVHPQGRQDGGVPRTVEETGAKLIHLPVGVLTYGDVTMPPAETGWAV